MPYCEVGDLVFCANYLNSAVEGFTHEYINALIGVQVAVCVRILHLYDNSEHFFIQMINAVNFIHKLDILHNDIKLNNWVLRVSSKSLCGINIALIDFGENESLQLLAMITLF